MKIKLNGPYYEAEGGQGGAGAAEATQGDNVPGGAEEAPEGAASGRQADETPEITDDLVEKLLGHEAFQKVIQSETDRVRTDYSSRLKQTMAELEELQKKHMTEKEREKYEREKLDRELKEREQRILRQEVQLTAANELAAVGLPASFIDFVAGENAEATKERIGKFSEVWRDELDKAVKEHFKEYGVTPGQQSGAGPTISDDMNNLIRQAAGRA